MIDHIKHDHDVERVCQVGQFFEAIAAWNDLPVKSQLADVFPELLAGLLRAAIRLRLQTYHPVGPMKGRPDRPGPGSAANFKHLLSIEWNTSKQKLTAHSVAVAVPVADQARGLFNLASCITLHHQPFHPAER